MKKLFTLLTLLVAIVTGASADGTPVADLKFEWPTTLPSAYTYSTSNSPAIATQGSKSCINVTSGGTATLPTFNGSSAPSGGKRWMAFRPAEDCEVTISTYGATTRTFYIYDSEHKTTDNYVSKHNNANASTWESTWIVELTGGTWYVMSADGSNAYVGAMQFATDDRDPLELSFTTTKNYMSVGDAPLASSFSILTDISSEAAEYSAVTYSSSKEGVATVDASGNITAVAKGSTTITATVTATEEATYKTTKANIKLYVIDPSEYYSYSGTDPVSISLEKKQIKGYDGGEGTAKDYLTVTADKWQSGNWDGIEGNFFNMSSTDRELALNVIGVSAFKVRVQNASAGRTYGISVNDVEKATITHGGTGVESSPIIPTGTTGAATIKLSGKGTGSTYPVRIILYNEDGEEITFPAGYTRMTLVPGKDLDFTSAEAKAYIATTIGASSVSTQSIDKLPAGTPVLLKLNDESEGNKGKTIFVPTATSTDDVSGNKLAVSDGNVDGGANIYAYTYDSTDNKYGFYPVGGSIKIPAGKAYLNSGLLGGPLSFNVDFEEVTAVQEVEAAPVANKAEVGKKAFVNGHLVIITENGIVNALGQSYK